MASPIYDATRAEPERAQQTIFVQRQPWYSTKGPVHHNHPRCTKGTLIGGKNRRAGDGRKPLCVECQLLNEFAE